MGKGRTAAYLALLAAAALAGRRLPARLLGLPQAAYRIRVQRDLRLPMVDGVRLATDHYAPQAAGPLPTVLIRTPYGRGNINRLTARLFAGRGYHVVCQDVRGRFDSEGSFEPYRHEAADGRATLAWIARQPWSDGRVGMWGMSYVGFVQWAAAAAFPEGGPLRAIMPIITRSRLARSAEEALPLDMTLRWLLLLEAQMDSRLSLRQRLARSFWASQQDRLLAPALDHLPLATADSALLGRPLPFYQAWMAHPDPADPYWERADYREQAAGTSAPAHLIAGWYDIFLSGQLADYAALHRAGRQPYLTIGPWTHLAAGTFLEGWRQGLAWFDAHLKGERGRLRSQPVRLYVMGAGEWRDLPCWPPPSRPTPYYLQPGAALATAPPPEDAAPDCYRYDPASPTPSLGGALMSGHAGPRDNRPLEARADVLTYTTPPLAAPLEVIGPVELLLYVRSSRAHTDFFGRLCDVYPDGRSINICDGLIRLEPGRGQSGPDGSLRLVVEMGATAYRFLPGHAVRLQISSGAHPRFARNPGTGEPPHLAVRLEPAEQTVYHDARRPSALLLPQASRS